MRDPKWRMGGTALTDFGGGAFDAAYALAVQNDGKVVAGGITQANGSDDFALARYNTDGSLDPTFGTGGKKITDVGSSSDDQIRAVLMEKDKKILVAGSSNASGSNDFAVGRYLSNGALDPTFGSGGLVTTDVSGSGSNDRPWGATLQKDGKLVVVGQTDAGGNLDFALARYLTK
jgi:uncharacterized delta-60 repeat protein